MFENLNIFLVANFTWCHNIQSNQKWLRCPHAQWGEKNICFLVVVFQSSYTDPSLSPRSAILLWSGTGKWLPWSNVKRYVWKISVYSSEDNARKRPHIFTFSLLLCKQSQTICRQLFTMQPKGDHSWLLATKAIAIAMIFSVCHCAPLCNKFHLMTGSNYVPIA